MSFLIFIDVIKLKSLIGETVNSMDIRIYWTFVLEAIRGKNPDNFYKQHQRSIDGIATELVRRFGPTVGGRAYRGIMLDDKDIVGGKVQHDSQITFVSFSEEKKVAIAFADTENPMWSFGRMLHPTKKGYLIEIDWKPEELLFHHQWLTNTNMWAFARQYYGSDARFLEIQKEVMLKPRPYYRVVPIKAGESGGMEVGT
jgi:hypothetical protein